MLYVIHVWHDFRLYGSCPCRRVTASGYRPIFSRNASSARWRGVARPCSHSCNVRRETFSLSAASD